MENLVFDDTMAREIREHQEEKRALNELRQELRKRERDYCERVCDRIKLYEERLEKCVEDPGPQCLVWLIFLNYWKHEREEHDCICSAD